MTENQPTQSQVMVIVKGWAGKRWESGLDAELSHSSVKGGREKIEQEKGKTSLNSFPRMKPPQG